MPYIGVILVVPHDFGLLQRFDALSRGALGDHTDIHVTAGEYLPEVVHLARIDRKALISGWDIQDSLANLEKLHAEIEQKTRSMGPTIFVDNAILVLLKRMAEISRLIGLATLLIAIPLLGIALDVGFQSVFTAHSQRAAENSASCACAACRVNCLVKVCWFPSGSADSSEASSVLL